MENTLAKIPKTLSVCLIVKNGENHLPETLESIREIADEVIIVNSPPKSPSLTSPALWAPPSKGDLEEGQVQTPRSVPTAQPEQNTPLNPLSRGDLKDISPVQLEKRTARTGVKWGRGESSLSRHSFPWNNDYSAVRNFAIEQATKDWILMLDEGDVLADADQLRQCLENPDVDIFYLKYSDKVTKKNEEYKFEKIISEKKFKYQGSQYLKPFLFRNKQFKFSGRVCERPEDLKIPPGKKEISRIFISRYYEEKAAQETNSQKIQLINLMLEKDEPDNLQTLYLKANLITRQLKLLKPGPQRMKLKEKILALNDEIEAAGIMKEFHFWYSEITSFFNEMNDLKNNYYLLNKALSVFPDSLNLLFQLYNLFTGLGRIFESIGVLNLMVQFLENRQPLTQEIKTVARELLDPGYLNYLRAIAKYEVCDYEAFEYYFKSINDPERYMEVYIQLKTGLNRRFNILNNIEDSLLGGEVNEINYFRMAREYIRELNYEKGQETYLHSLKLAFKNDNTLLQSFIFSDLILNAKKMALEPEFISEIIEEGKAISENFSYYWYALGKYYLGTGYPQEATVAFTKAFQTEQELQDELNDYQNFKIDFVTGFDPFLFFKIQQALEQANTFTGQAFMPFSGDLPAALQYFHRKDFSNSLLLFLSLKEGTGHDSSNYEKYVIYDYLAITYEWLGDYKNAELVNREAFAFFQENDLYTRAIACSEHYYWKIFKKLPAGLMMHQVKSEWVECLKEIAGKNPGVVLEIGSYKGGSLYSISEFSREDATLVSIDMPFGLFGGSEVTAEDFIRLEREIKKNRPQQKFYPIRADSHIEESRGALVEILNGRKIDVLFIDGDHTYEGVKKDFEMYSPLVSDDGIIIFHDIVDHVTDPNTQVHRYWGEVIREFTTKEFIESEQQCWAGIGIILKKKDKIFYDKFNLVNLQVPGWGVMKPVYEDNFSLVSYAFDDLGIEYSQTYNELRKGYNNILFQAHSNSDLSNYLLGYTYIPFQMEQLPIYNFDLAENNGYMRLLKGAAMIWDFSLTNLEYLNSIGINNVLYLPFGYHHKMKIINFDKEKTIDILFYGELNLKRAAILNNLAEKGYRVVALEFVFGEERNQYIEKAKIILNISRYSNNLLEEHRLSFLLNNGCFVISEPVENMKTNEYRDSIVFCNYNKIIETCEYYLKPENETLRKQISKRGYKNFSKIKFTDNLKKVLKLTVENF
jgi:predicted O-methyltransferase YrrM